MMARAAVVKDGAEFRVYDDEDRLGDLDHLQITLTAPRTCLTEREKWNWFDGTPLAKSLGKYLAVTDE